ncbi:DUF2231 domain-containing protein [Candidatus Berkiella aquae]|uniref:DUF2231 domain-containing protein n=1 Tax=Candidatus Berkiella aquae TaxID=295108 RepID=A0A0Q9YHU4_9GAMM|nr:DUF2231 domain-containing protein [Candidatus Berkiella aquae]MCS5712795.1 DUF2231 domain-containing protein [Candidatus Berkiella aquae]
MFDFPLHPVFVHFTVALSFTAIGAYLISYILPVGKLKNDLGVSAVWMILFSFIATLFTVTFGFIQFNSVRHDMLVHLPMVSHRNWALGTAVVLFMCSLLALRGYIANKIHHYSLMISLLILGFMVGMTAFKGGHLVYGYGVGVKSTAELRDLQKSTSEEPKRDNLFEMNPINK